MAVSVLAWQKKGVSRSLSGVSFIKGTVLIHEDSTLRPNCFLKALIIPSHWELGIQQRNFGVDAKHSGHCSRCQALGKVPGTHEMLGISTRVSFLLINLLYLFCFQDAQPDKEIVVDTIMFLWQKCKLGLQRLNVARNDSAKLTQKISTNKVFVFVFLQMLLVIASLICDTYFKSKFSLFIHLHNYCSFSPGVSEPSF